MRACNNKCSVGRRLRPGRRFRHLAHTDVPGIQFPSSRPRPYYRARIRRN
ncbi:hypothetical protein MMALV_15120 [Candidatus Methanomethylophilus alvi Mx1201]|uniref:Uncharacterized protein n=1 Tax=Methanomethylophilus alvi (strain Mx1201) TaxID=1236689 RepID=M9SFQ0_METAX|nr:hypothetical protein MMALV_15120 [Candidatus Methanomethylophilus alvi Mx1201]